MIESLSQLTSLPHIYCTDHLTRQDVLSINEATNTLYIKSEEGEFTFVRVNCEYGYLVLVLPIRSLDRFRQK